MLSRKTISLMAVLQVIGLSAFAGQAVVPLIKNQKNKILTKRSKWAPHSGRWLDLYGAEEEVKNPTTGEITKIKTVRARILSEGIPADSESMYAPDVIEEQSPPLKNFEYTDSKIYYNGPNGLRALCATKAFLGGYFNLEDGVEFVETRKAEPSRRYLENTFGVTRLEDTTKNIYSYDLVITYY